MAPITKETDYLVLGGGSGGVAGARAAAGKFGVKALLVENNRLGGTCVNVGYVLNLPAAFCGHAVVARLVADPMCSSSCVPKKITFTAAAIAEAMHDAKSYGFSVQQTAPFDWTTFKTKRDAYIKRLNGIYDRNLEKEKVDYLHGWGRLLSKNQVEVTMDDGSKVIVNAKKILVAVGGRPADFPDIPGAEHGINSDGFFDIDKQPKKVAIVGAGYIAVEFAGMFNTLGTETHLLIRNSTFLRNFDPMIQDTVTKEYERAGVNLHKKSNATKIEKDANGKLSVTYKDDDGNESTLTDVDHLIWAVGRVPNTRGIGLEEAGLKLTKKGYVVADEYQNTSVDNIYALGDVTGEVELTPVAIAAARRLAARLFGPPQFSNLKLSYENIPSVVFSHPEVGSIGLSEPQAVEKYGRENLKIYTSGFTGLYYAMMEPEQKGPSNYKLICAGPEEKVVGLHIMGQGSGEMLQGFGVAIKMGATKADFDSCVAIHPTSAEEIVTMK